MEQKETIKMNNMNKTLKPEYQIREVGGEFISVCRNCKHEVKFKTPTLEFKCPSCGFQNHSQTAVLIGIILAVIFAVVAYLVFVW